jgi:type IV pilus assembly protein PilC
MVKTAEMTGDLPSILDDMAEYYTSIDQTRKQMKSAMTYPLVVLAIAIGVLIFMLTYLVPQFSSLFEANGATLPALTLAVMGVSQFIQANWVLILLILAVVGFGLYEIYTHVQKFRQGVQTILMHVPVCKDIIIYNEIANFTKTFASLLNHGVFITDSMEILSKITNNEVYQRITNKTLENLGKGDSISSAFKGEWAIPVVAYEMIVTGERTGQLPEMMAKVSAYYQELHQNSVTRIKTFIEPILIVFLTAMVGVIVLSIVLPMFNMYQSIQQTGV